MPTPPQLSLATEPFSADVGQYSSIFKPPTSPPTTNASPFFSTSHDYFSHESRKRSRGDSSFGRHHAQAQQTPFATTPNWRFGTTPSDGIFSGFGQHSALVNERYRLADGYDTPGIQATYQNEQALQGANGCRRRLRNEDMPTPSNATHAPIFGPLARERNGAARIPAYADRIPQHTWTGFAFGLVGKVFSFGTTVIKGFYAGGGTGYDMNGHSNGEGYLSVAGQAQSGPIGTPIPGSWAEDEFPGDYDQDSHTPISTGRPPNKRRQTDRDTWVMVGTPDLEAPAQPMPRRKTSSNSVPRSNLPPRPTASRASSRQNIAPVSRRSSYVGMNGSPSQNASFAMRMADRRASLAPTRSPQARPSSAGSNAVLLSPEAEKFAKRRAKQERQNDRAMNSMSRKMDEMIRQAQEALGMKISIEADAGIELEDEGFVDDDW